MPSPFLMDFSQEPDLRHRVRRMRSFEDLFERNLDEINQSHRFSLTLNRARLRAAFLTWLDNFGQTRPFASVDRDDFIRYSAGRMFAELIRHHVISANDEDRDSYDPARIWPEGYAYANFCLSIAINVLKQEGRQVDQAIKILQDQRIWQSFRENALLDPDIAIGFFDLMLGIRPNWKVPQLVERRFAMRRQLRR